MTQHYGRALHGTGLRANQFTTLSVLAQAGPLPMAQLAEMLGMDRTSLTRNLQPLARSGWIGIAPGVDDARNRIASITRSGTATLRQALPAWRTAQASVAPLLGRRKVASRG